MSNKRSNVPLWKKYNVVVSFSGENCTKVAKLAKDFDIPRKNVDYNFEK